MHKIVGDFETEGVFLRRGADGGGEGKGGHGGQGKGNCKYYLLRYNYAIAK